MEISTLDGFKKFMNEVQELEQNESNYSGDAILFVGPTKSGKSTLINCLLENELSCKFDEISNEWIFENFDLSTQNPKISSISTETSSPQLYETNGLQLWDVPGFENNLNWVLDMKQPCLTKMLIEKHNAVSFVLVVEENLITQNNQMPLVEIINTVGGYSRDIGQHIFIVVTKTTNNNWRNKFNKLLNWIPSSEENNYEKIKRAKSIILEVIKKNAGYAFKKPKFDNEGETYTYEFPDHNLISRIEDVEKIDIIDCPYIFNPGAEIILFKMATELSHTMSKELCNFYESQCKKRINAWQLKSLHNFKESLSTKWDFKDFLDHVKNISSNCENAYSSRLLDGLDKDFKIASKLKEMKLFDMGIFNSTIEDAVRRVKEYVELKCKYQEELDKLRRGGHACNIL